MFLMESAVVSRSKSSSGAPFARAGKVAALDDDSALTLWGADSDRRHFKPRRIERDQNAVRRCLGDLRVGHRALADAKLAARWCKQRLAEEKPKKISTQAQLDVAAVTRFHLFVAFPEENALLTEILEGFWQRLVGSRHRNVKTAEKERDNVLRFVDAMSFPWRNDKRTVDAYNFAMVERKRALETQRGAQGAPKRFIDYAKEEFDDRIFAVTGLRLEQIFTPDNTLKHLWNTPEGEVGRPLEDDELVRFFDVLRARQERSLRDGRKGLWTARRDMAMFQIMFATGARDSCLESAKIKGGLPRAYTPEIKKYSYYEEIHFLGKAEPGGRPKPRSVWAIEYFRDQWAELRRYTLYVRPHFAASTNSDALFLGERGPLKANEISSIFHGVCIEAGLPKDIHAHCLRHTFAEILVRLGVDYDIIRQLLGHANIKTTMRYAKLPPQYAKARMIQCGRRQRAEVDALAEEAGRRAGRDADKRGSRRHPGAVRRPGYGRTLPSPLTTFGSGDGRHCSEG